MQRVRGVGIGFRRQLAADLLSAPGRVDFLEVVAETCFASRVAAREARALAEVWPVVPHGVTLSLGSACGIDRERARRLGTLARDVGAELVTEHVAFTSAGGVDVGHLTALPRTREAVRVVARNVATARRDLPDVPLLLENIASTLRWPDDALADGDFHAAIAEATGCDLLLDVANLHANAVNAGERSLDALARFPLHRVGLVHIAGGVFEEGHYADTHGAAVPEVVFELLEVVLARVDAPVVLERDAGFGDFEALAGELGRVRAAPRGPPRCSTPRAPADVPPLVASDAELDRAQRDLVAALVGDVGQPLGGFAGTDVARTRRVLEKKRVDAAIALLPRLAAACADLRALGAAALRDRPRSRTITAVADARLVAAEAATFPAFADAAAIDALLLRARFTAASTARAGAFVGKARAFAKTFWAVKVPGANAAIHLHPPFDAREALP